MRVTDHAVAQFRARIAPGLDVDAARAVILHALATCARAPVPSQHGIGAYVRVRGPVHFRAVIVEGAVVTILPSGDRGRSQTGERRQRARRQRRRLTRALGAE